MKNLTFQSVRFGACAAALVFCPTLIAVGQPIAKGAVELLKGSNLVDERIGNPAMLFHRELQIPPDATRWYYTNFGEENRPATEQRNRAAGEMVEEYVHQNPGASALLFLAGTHFNSANEPNRARIAWEKAVTVAPDLRQNFKIYAALAGQYFARSDLGERSERNPIAQRYFIQALQDPSLLREIIGPIGLVHLYAHNPLAAEAALRKALMINSDDRDMKLALADAVRQQAKPALGNAIAYEALESDPDNRRLWRIIANNLVAMDKPERVIAVYETLRRMGTPESDVLHQLGRLYVGRQMFELAAEAHIDAIKADPKQDPDYALDAVETLKAFRAFDEGLSVLNAIREHLTRALTDEETIRHLTLQADIMIAQGRGAQAVAPLEAIIQRDPTQGDAILTLARHYERSDRPIEIDRAKELYELASELEDFRYDALLALGTLHVKLREWRSAVQRLEAALMIKEEQRVREFYEQVARRFRLYEATGQ